MGSTWETHMDTTNVHWPTVNNRTQLLLQGHWGAGSGQRVPVPELAGPQPQRVGAKNSPHGTQVQKEGKESFGGMSQTALTTTHLPEVQLLLGAKANTGHVPSQGQFQCLVPMGRHSTAGTHCCCCHLPLLCWPAFTCQDKLRYS